MFIAVHEVSSHPRRSGRIRYYKIFKNLIRNFELNSFIVHYWFRKYYFSQWFINLFNLSRIDSQIFILPNSGISVTPISLSPLDRFSSRTTQLQLYIVPTILSCFKEIESKLRLKPSPKEVFYISYFKFGDHRFLGAFLVPLTVRMTSLPHTIPLSFVEIQRRLKML